MTGLELLTPPASEPVTLAEIKAQARIDQDEEDDLLTGLVTAARQRVEQATGLALMPQTWRAWLDDWPGARFLELPKPPVQSVTEIRIHAADDSSTAWDAAATLLDGAAHPARLLLREGEVWPVPGRSFRGISITFVAGHADAAAVPAPLKLAIGQLAAHWFAHRGEAGAGLQETPFGVSALLAPYRLVRL